MKRAVGLSAWVLFLFPLPAGAQIGGLVGRGPVINSESSLNDLGSLSTGARPVRSNAPAVFHVITVSGSGLDFVPSSFVDYDQAVARGGESARYFYVPYDQAVAKGITNLPDRPTLYMTFDQATAQGMVDLAAEPKSLVRAARELRRETKSKSQAIFVQDNKGRIVRQSN
jgi:hypothetical protein